MTPPEQSAEHWVPVSVTVTCNRCGKGNLAWQHSKHSKKYYLCVTRTTKDGVIEANRRGFHHCQPATKNSHGLEVSDADIPF